jgi:hypothetical protein
LASSDDQQLHLAQKIKDRRISELSETSIHTPDTAISSTPPQQLSIITSSDIADSQLPNKSLVLNKNNSLLNSPNAQSPNSLIGSPRAYKKLLLSKVVNETINSLREMTEKFDLNSLVGNGYESIERNVYRCQK